MAENVQLWYTQKAGTSASISQDPPGKWDPEWPQGHSGTVETPHGIVRVSSTFLRRGRRGERNRYRQHTMVAVVHEGVTYYGKLERPWSRRLGVRGLTIQAREWAERVVEGRV